ncbi:hypothetical protein [Actinobacillus pleuropneumoniae]|uniref:hypothetical protein n=1 Tax=Actinobacillus pleuropneumoniae TaxID=715 RepID=UPI003B0298A2
MDTTINPFSVFVLFFEFIGFIVLLILIMPHISFILPKKVRKYIKIVRKSYAEAINSTVVFLTCSFGIVFAVLRIFIWSISLYKAIF